MKKNSLFCFYDPVESLVMDAYQEVWTAIGALLENGQINFQQVTIFYWPHNEAQLKIFVEILKNKHVNAEFITLAYECQDEADIPNLTNFIYRHIVKYPFDYKTYDYFFQPARDTAIRAFLYYFSTSNKVEINYVDMLPPFPPFVWPGKLHFRSSNLSIYAGLALKCRQAEFDGQNILTSGLVSYAKSFTSITDELECAILRSNGPILLSGPSGSGKSRLAKGIYELAKSRGRVKGQFVQLNCGSVTGEAAYSQLFGHTKGAYTGAYEQRDGLLRTANNGILFLDEIALLDKGGQAILLKAIEEKRWFPMGSDKETESDFILLCATNADLVKEVQAGRFREDLMARISAWHFQLPDLKSRPEDFEINLDYELQLYSSVHGLHIAMTPDARRRYLEFARSRDAIWRHNFRDFSSSVRRMSAHAINGVIGLEVVNNELYMLREAWACWDCDKPPTGPYPLCERLLDMETYAHSDQFALAQLEYVLDTCRRFHTLAETGRYLFSASRERKKSSNDSHRLKHYLEKFGLNWAHISKTL